MSISAITTPPTAPTSAPPPSAAVTPAYPATSASASSSSTSSSSGSATTSAAVVYSTPTQTFDPSTGAAVVETRNTATGIVESQTPDKAALQYERSKMLAAEKADTQGHHNAV